MKIKENILLLILLFPYAKSGFAFSGGDTLALSLKEAVYMGLEHNKQLRSSEKNIEIYKVRIRESVSTGLPQINIKGNYSTNFGHKIKFGEGASFKLEDQYNITGTIQQLLFSGEWIVGVQTSKLAKKMAEEEFLINEAELKNNIFNAYYLILTNENFIKIMHENIRNMEDILRQNENMYRAGAIESTDVDQMRINLGQIRNSLSSMERTVTVNYNLLKLLLGMDSGKNIKLKNSLKEILDAETYRTILMHRFDIEENLKFKLMQTNNDIQKKMVELKKWGYAPTVSGSYNYTHKLRTAGFDMSPKSMASININIPLFNGLKKRAEVDKEKISLEQSVLNKEFLKDQLFTEEQQLLFSLKNATENYNLQKENKEVASRILTKMTQKYRLGSISSLELTQANNNYLQAETNYASAVLSLLQAELQLRKLYNRFIY